MCSDEEVERRGEGKGCDCRFGIVIFSLAWGLTIYFLVCRLLRFFFGFLKEKRSSAVAVAVAVSVSILSSNLMESNRIEYYIYLIIL